MPYYIKFMKQVQEIVVKGAFGGVEKTFRNATSVRPFLSYDEKHRNAKII